MIYKNMNNIIDNIKNSVDTLSLADIYNITDILNERKEYLLANELLDLPSYGELVQFDTFIKWMESGSVYHDDGIGYYATATESSRLPFKFFDLDDEKKLKKYKFTHILWYNK